MRFIFYCILLTILTILSNLSECNAQVDLTKYVSDDFFSVSPVIDQESMIEDNDDNGFTSQFQFEMTTGFAFWENGELDEAIYHFEQMSDEYEIPILKYYLGMIQYEKDNYDASILHFSEVLDENPLFLEAKYMLGIIAVETENRKLAKTYFKELIAIPAYQAYGYHGMGTLGVNDGSPFFALKNFKKCLIADSTFQSAYAPLIFIYLYLDNVRSARKLIEKGLEIYPKWENGIMMRAMISVIEEQNTEQFEKDVNYLIQLNPDNYHYYSMKGYLEYEYGNYSKAVNLFHKAYNLSLDSVRTGEFKFNSRFKTEESIQRSLNYYMDNFAMDLDMRAYLDRGICEFVLDNKNGSLDYLDSAITIGDNSVVYTFKASVHKAMFGHLEKAVSSYSKAIELDSINWIAYSYRGTLNMKLGNVEEAYSDFNKVIELKPGSKEGYKNRGNVLIENGHYMQAYKDYSIAIGIDKTDTDLFLNRAMASLSLKELAIAMVDLNEILKINTNDGEAYYLKYRMFLNLGDTLWAIACLDSASKFVKHKNEYHKELLQMATDNQLDEQVTSAYNRLIKYNSWQHSYRLERGKYLLERGKYKEALLDLKKYVKRIKRSGEGNYYLAKTYSELGNLEDASKHMRKSVRLGYRIDR